MKHSATCKPTIPLYIHNLVDPYNNIVGELYTGLLLRNPIELKVRKTLSMLSVKLLAINEQYSSSCALYKRARADIRLKINLIKSLLPESKHKP